MTHAAAKLLAALAFAAIAIGGCWLLAKMDCDEELKAKDADNEKS